MMLDGSGTTCDAAKVLVNVAKPALVNVISKVFVKANGVAKFVVVDEVAAPPTRNVLTTAGPVVAPVISKRVLVLERKPAPEIVPVAFVLAPTGEFVFIVSVSVAVPEGSRKPESETTTCTVSGVVIVAVV
jgi:hypothetical protein